MSTFEGDQPQSADDSQVQIPEELAALLQGSNAGFAEGFADRVMARVDELPLKVELGSALRTQFRRVAAIGMAASIALAVFNATQIDSTRSQTVLEAIFGLEPVDAETGLDALYSIEVPLSEEGTS